MKNREPQPADDQASLMIEELAAQPATADLEARHADVWAPEQPRRLSLGELRKLFGGHGMTPAVIRRASSMGIIEIRGLSVMVKSPRLLGIGLGLLRDGIPMTEMLDELEALQDMGRTIAARFGDVLERNKWQPFVDAGLPRDGIRPLTESLGRLTALTEEAVEVILRDAMRAKAGEFLAQQAERIDSAGLRDEIAPIARSAGLDL